MIAAQMLCLVALVLSCMTAAPVAAIEGEPEVPIPADIRIDDPQLGSIRVKVTDVGEPANMPLRISVMAKCLDRRGEPDARKPRWEPIITSQPICYFGPYAFENGKPKLWDRARKIVVLHYSISPFTMGQLKCSRHLDQVFDMQEHCVPWAK